MEKKVPNQGPGSVITLGSGTDKFGIEVKITMHVPNKEVTVFAFKDKTHRVMMFPANRFGFGLADSVHAMAVADELAAEIQTELKL